MTRVSGSRNARRLIRRTHRFRFDGLVRWKGLHDPLDWEEIFHRAAPRVLEIGFGRGDYLRSAAADDPSTDFIGVDTHWSSVIEALAGVERDDLENVRLLQGDARVVLSRLFEPRSLQAVIALFPVPWPKEQKSKNRLFSDSFLRLANSRLVNGGTLRVVTDYAPYVKWILKQNHDTGFVLRHTRITRTYGTRYESKYYQRGQREFDELLFTKEAHRDVPVEKGVPLGEYRLEGFDPERFRPEGGRFGEITLAFKDFLYDPVRRKGMVRVVVVEGSLVQSIWIEIVFKEGAWRVRSTPDCGVVPSEGVNRALEIVRDAAQAGA